jgi:chromosome segregation ATPase
MDFDRFAKVLALLESDNDGEALAAARSVRRMSAKAGISLHEIALAARDGFAGCDADELERLSEETRALRREVRRLNAVLRAAGPRNQPAPTQPDGEAARRALKLERKNKELTTENERLLDVIDALSEKIEMLNHEKESLRDDVFELNDRLSYYEKVNNILINQSEDLIRYLSPD